MSYVFFEAKFTVGVHLFYARMSKIFKNAAGKRKF